MVNVLIKAFPMVPLSCISNLAGGRVSTEVTFWHSAEYGSDFRLNSGEIPRNSAEFRGISPEFSRNHFRSQKIPRNSVLAEFRGHPSRRVPKISDNQLCHRYTLLAGYSDYLWGVYCRSMKEQNSYTVLIKPKELVLYVFSEKQAKLAYFFLSHK